MEAGEAAFHGGSPLTAWRIARDLLGGFASRARNSIGARRALHERQAQQFDNKKREDDTQG
jgi:hypothetical protein